MPIPLEVFKNARDIVHEQFSNFDHNCVLKFHQDSAFNIETGKEEAVGVQSYEFKAKRLNYTKKEMNDFNFSVSDFKLNINFDSIPLELQNAIKDKNDSNKIIQVGTVVVDDDLVMQIEDVVVLPKYINMEIFLRQQ